MRTRSTLTWHQRIAVAAAASVTVAVGAVSAAHADPYVNWASASNPQTVTGYGSTAYTYGQWRVSNNRSWLDAYTWYTDGDNHKKYVYFETEWNLYGSWNGWEGLDDETGHSDNESGEWLYADTGLKPGSNQSRARVKACLDIPWRSDPCSPSWVWSPSNYHPIA